MYLDSVLNQTYQNIELVCVNDGSLDKCSRILEKYAAMDERILIVEGYMPYLLLFKKIIIA